MDDSFWDAPSTGNDLDLPAFFDSGVTDGIIGILQLGVLVSIGLTRDGGALGIAVFNDGRRRREYFRKSDDAADWLRVAVVALSGNGARPTGTDRPVAQKPTRGR